MVTNRAYNTENARLTEILTTHNNDTLQFYSYNYDKIANLAARTDHVHDMREDFTYDRLNRLTGIVEDGDTTARFDYDAYGRMLRKYMHSALVFDSAAYNASDRPHAITQAQTPTDLPLHRMRYTHFDKLAYLEQDTLALSYIYGYEHQRLHMTEASIYGDTLIEKEYVDNCEYIDNDLYTTTLTYLSGPLGVFGVQEKRDGYRPDCYFIHPDHLGSWTLVTDSYANIRQDVMYDAWGTPYGFDETDTTALVPVQSLLFDRGFTGHEHLLYFGLINMNGRMYDPFTSGFLSVDNYVQSPDYTQSFNRYAYCLNNPLKYTDPDGEFWHLIIGAAIGGIANLVTNWGKIDTFGEGLAYFGIGAAAGALGAVTGGAAAGLLGTATTLSSSVASGAISGAVGGFSSGFVTGAGNAWMQGANMGQGLASGLKAGGKGALIGGAVGGISGGLQYGRTTRLFRKGCERANISPNEDIQMMNDSKLSSLREEWFPDMDMDNIIKMSIDNPGEHLESMIKEGATGVTVPQELDGLLTGKSSVYFNRANIADLKELFFSMGHEFVHVSQISVLQGELSSIINEDFIKLMDFHAYNFEAHLGKTQFGMYDNSDRTVLQLFPKDLVNKMNWMNFGYLRNVHMP